LNVLCASVLVALASVPPALPCDGHNGVRAEIDPLPPALRGVRVEVHRTMGPQLVLDNRGGRTVEVLDETGAPFVRIGPRGVEGNVAAPSWYRTYSPAAAVPAAAADGAAPRWLRAGAEPAFGWFEVRIDAARIAVPEAVRAAGAAADLGAWAVPLRIDGEPVVLTGRFRYEPPPAGVFVSRLIGSPVLAPSVRVTLLPGRVPGMMVHNSDARPLVVYGVDGEPFLRLGPDGVEANLHSPTWRASGRAGVAAAAVDPGGAPAWRRVAAVPRYSWIEPRAGQPADAPGHEPRRWRVPMRLGDQPVEVTGEVVWRPIGSDPT
jgi:hypothetical protein